MATGPRSPTGRERTAAWKGWTAPAWLAAAAATGSAACLPGVSEAQETLPPPRELARVVASVERLNDMRERLATTFLGEGGIQPDEETFRRVCRPVGMRAASLAEENGWQVRQLAVRYRNPAHAPDEAGRELHRKLEEDGDLVGLWARDTLDGGPGIRYARRITVREACLACHGAKADRPAFVKERYPEDRAHGFEVGDLRGLYSVFVPADPGERDTAEQGAPEPERDR